MYVHKAINSRSAGLLIPFFKDGLNVTGISTSVVIPSCSLTHTRTVPFSSGTVGLPSTKIGSENQVKNKCIRQDMIHNILEISTNILGMLEVIINHCNY